MSMGITVVALGVLYPQLLSIPVGDYLPFLAISFVAWTFISALITESCTAFIAGEGIIKQAAIPLSVHIFRLIWRNLIVLAHNCVIFIVIAAAMGLSMGWPALAGFCGLALVTLLVFPVGLILAALCARFRDIPPMVASLVQLAFFITPVLWSPRMMPEGRLFILTFNPFYHVMTVIRDPFLGNMVAFDSWGVVAALTVLAWMAALFLIGRLGHRVPYWL